MKLKNQEKNEMLNNLLIKVQKQTEAFNAVQDRLLEINQNLERNKKTLEALSNENAELQDKSSKVTVSETGEVSFAEFDDYSEQIFKNERKIETLNKYIYKFKCEKELILLTDYNDKKLDLNATRNSIFKLIAESLLIELVEDEIILSKINDVFNAYRLSNEYGYNNLHDVFFNLLKSKLAPVLVKDELVVDGLPVFDVRLSIPSHTLISRPARINELRHILQ
ncbi:hypothetical protein BMT54_08340 [Pasteurellaceae bacterium 15-036681]|nr:hypothetical protein BMT54_08340 [Pasteurellaceae bacterium 15-036681]